MLCRIAAIALVLALTACGMIAYLEAGYIGFPDGYVSDADRVRSRLLFGSGVLSAVSAAWILYRGVFRDRLRPLQLLVAWSLFLLAAVIVWLLDARLSVGSGVGG
jgi:hypothetical protein